MSYNLKDEEKILSPAFLEEIKKIREQRNISIDEVAEKTNIKASYIEAIEEGNLDKLPGGIYNKAYIKSVSEFLGINMKPYERSAESDEIFREREVKVELGRPLNTSMPSKITIIGCFLTIFVLYNIYYGPKISKKEQVNNAINNYVAEQTKKSQDEIEKAQSEQEKLAIQNDLQQKTSDTSGLIKQIPQVSPIKKTTVDQLNKELVITLLAIKDAKVAVKDSYGKEILNKTMVASEAIMLNGSDKYSLLCDNINNLEIYLDGVQIRDSNKIERNGNAYILKTENLVGVAESQPLSEEIAKKDVPANLENGWKNIEKNSGTDQNANQPQNNPQGSGR